MKRITCTAYAFLAVILATPAILCQNVSDSGIEFIKKQEGFRTDEEKEMDQGLGDKKRKFFYKLRSIFQTEDWVALSELYHYPDTFDVYCEDLVANSSAEFISLIDTLFPKNTRELIANQEYMELWVSWRGAYADKFRFWGVCEDDDCDSVTIAFEIFTPKGDCYTHLIEQANRERIRVDSSFLSGRLFGTWVLQRYIGATIWEDPRFDPLIYVGDSCLIASSVFSSPVWISCSGPQYALRDTLVNDYFMHGQFNALTLLKMRRLNLLSDTLPVISITCLPGQVAVSDELWWYDSLTDTLTTNLLVVDSTTLIYQYNGAFFTLKRND